MPSIKIDRDRCKGCYFCREYCPRHLIIISDTHNRLGYFPAEFKDSEEKPCTGCKTCALMCPDTAIEVYK
jgi:2-oxoglutarate ferredoxin oxidoreductase subunit delta